MSDSKTAVLRAPGDLVVDLGGFLAADSRSEYVTTELIQDFCDHSRGQGQDVDDPRAVLDALEILELAGYLRRDNRGATSHVARAAVEADFVKQH